MYKIFNLLLVVFLLAGASTTYTNSITLDQINPVYGQQVTFTEIFYKVYNGRQPQFPNQPSTQVDCVQNGVRVYSENMQTIKKKNLGQGWSQSTAGPFTLAAYGGNGFTWSSGAATCTATMYYFDGDIVLQIMAQTQFEVGP